MELSIKIIVMMVLVVLVLAVVGFFVFSQSSGATTETDFNRIFAVKCQDYKLKSCDWSVTQESDFSDFLNACRYLYGSQSEAYSCLYLRCSACKKSDIDTNNIALGLKCSSTCEQCRADSAIDVKTSCCQQFNSQCSSSGVSCSDTCP